jgi:hypothetical protein
MHPLRHTAVHRIRTTARGLSELIKSALNFTEALKYSIRSIHLESLYREIESRIKAMELNDYLLDEASTVIFQNELDGIVPQGESYSLEEEIEGLFEVLSSTSKHQSGYYNASDENSDTESGSFNAFSMFDDWIKDEAYGSEVEEDSTNESGSPVLQHASTFAEPEMEALYQRLMRKSATTY